MAKTKLGPLADKLAKSIKDERDVPGWEEALWEELQWLDLDFKQADILFGMIVSRWEKARRASYLALRAGAESSAQVAA